ncbi:hypothetical protein J6590_069136 [Homalodisca vitripennis]|nr:hypothetical protein J6590_069136 [Homalodisca vitripennis]
MNAKRVIQRIRLKKLGMRFRGWGGEVKREKSSQRMKMSRVEGENVAGYLCQTKWLPAAVHTRLVYSGLVLAREYALVGYAYIRYSDTETCNGIPQLCCGHSTLTGLYE